MEGFNLTIILVLLLILFSSMDFKHKIIQWNCRGLKPNYNEVSLLISEYNPSVFCFQETFLKPDDYISLRGFNVYNYVHTDCLRPSGGASIFVKSSFPQRKIDLQTELQATAVSVTLDREITICSAFCHNSSSFKYSESFRKIKTEQEKVKLNFKSQNNEIYNKDFNLDELVEAIQLSHDSATGPDEIHYQMLKHLPDTSLETLLNIFNYIWTTGKFPEDWTLATIIPIPKPGKDPAEPNNYRPIALTSCLCKTLERMINKRLTWFLESNNHISRFQSGFRSDRSTTDNLVRLETFIRDAFIKKEHVVAVFFDLEKAYDTTWRYGILKDIHKLGLRGRLPTFIENFLADRVMQVRVGSFLSDYYDQEQGVPQGGVLSTTLFSIKINDVVKCLGNLTDCSLYVDDF